MGNISFSNFNSRSFEQFTQALAAGVLGPGILVFGDGPDGGREASFEGVVPYPSREQKWSGYIILQTKYKTKPQNTSADASWLAAQIDSELSYFQSHPERRRPDYYIIATNVNLSSVVGKKAKGGQQKIDSVMRKYRDLGVKDYRIWHPDVMEAVLANFPELRKNYLGWLLPQDVLSEVFLRFRGRNPDFKKTMLLYLQRELREQRGTRLQQAGHIGDGATNLESIFTDLPYQESNNHNASPEGRGVVLEPTLDDDEIEPLLGRDLLYKSFSKLDQQTLNQERGRKKAIGNVGDRYLILGGPGQGKSTISQFVAQVMRARILREEQDGVLSGDIRSIISLLNEKMNKEKFPSYGVNRFPVRVDLPVFADKLNQAEAISQSMSLLNYVASHINRVTGVEIDVADMRHWLSLHPWAIFLDGLDEVPPSSNRNSVIRAINEFWDEVSIENADVFMAVTTRPQGYNSELDPQYYGILELTKLDQRHAIAYATRLADVRLSSAEQKQRVLSRMKEAAQSPTTALLMISPLQVAIMFALIDQSGHVPRDRWSLFNEYFSVVVRREQEKFGIVGEIVKKRLRSITEIVQKAGFILHCLAELPGAANPRFGQPKFAELVQTQMEEDGFCDLDVIEGVKDITYVATARLVFLEQRIEGEIGFEVRSLQEYMAAAFIMSGREIHVQERLRQISNKVHWQHVFKIAASKCFSMVDAAQYRDTIIAICGELESCLDDADRLCHRGGAVALSLLSDGLGNDLPIYQRHLLSNALNLTKIGPDAVNLDLINFASKRNINVVEIYLTEQLSGKSKLGVLGAWKLLNELVIRGVDWAEPMANAFWPADVARQAEIALTPLTAIPTDQMRSRFESAIFSMPPTKISYIVNDRKRHRPRVGNSVNGSIYEAFPLLKILKFAEHKEDLQIGLFRRGGHLNLGVTSLRSGGEVFKVYERHIPKEGPWAGLRQIIEFARDQDAPSLARALRAAGRIPEFDPGKLYGIPWPFTSIASMADGPQDFHELAGAVSSSEFGIGRNWRDAEVRLTAKGASRQDFDIWSRDIYFDYRIAALGLPRPTYSNLTMENTEEYKNWVQDLVDMFLSLSDNRITQSIYFIIRHVIKNYKVREFLDVSRAISLANIQGDEGRVYFDSDIIYYILPACRTDSSLAEELSKIVLSDKIYVPVIRSAIPLANQLILSNPSKLELLIWWLASIGSTRVEDLSVGDDLRRLAEIGAEHDDANISLAATIILSISHKNFVYSAAYIENCVNSISKFFVGVIIEMATGGYMPLDFQNVILTSLANASVDDGDHPIIDTLIRSLDRRRSAIPEGLCWGNLGFKAELLAFLNSNIVKSENN